MDSKPGERSICCTELKDDHVLLPLGFHLLPPRFVPSNYQPESILYAYRYSASCDILWDRGYGFFFPDNQRTDNSFNSTNPTTSHGASLSRAWTVDMVWWRRPFTLREKKYGNLVCCFVFTPSCIICRYLICALIRIHPMAPKTFFMVRGCG